MLRKLESRIQELEKENEQLRRARIFPKGVISYPEQFRVLVESLNDGLVVSNEETKFTYVNKVFCEMLGYKAEELVGRPATDHLDEASHAGFAKEMEKRRKGRTSRYKKTFVAKDGRRVLAIVTGTPIMDEHGRYKGSFAVVKDLTEQNEVVEKLERKTKAVEEADIALRILLEKRSADKVEFGKQVVSNVKLLIEPYLEKLEASELNKKQKAYLDVLKKNLKDILSAFPCKLSDKYAELTPSEIQVANLVKQGRRTKEIANFLNLSSRTVAFHRENIRKKLGLKEKNKNLATQLMSLE